MKLFSVLAALFAGIASVNAYGNGVDTCEITPGHGTWAQGCNPTNCFAAGGTALLPYVIEVTEGNRVVNNYVPNTQYSIILRSTNPNGTCSPTTCFKGFVINVGAGRINGNFATVSANANITSGTLNLDPADTNVRRMSSCNNGLTHNSNSDKRNARMIWVSPPLGSGPVTFKSIIVTSRTTPNYIASMMLNERPSPSASPMPSRSNSISASFYATSDCSGTPSLTNIAINQNICIGDASSSGAKKYYCSDNILNIISFSDTQCLSILSNNSYTSGACIQYSNAGVYTSLTCPAASPTPSNTPNTTGTPTNTRTMRASRTSSSTSSNTQSFTATISLGLQPSLSSSTSYSSSSTPSVSVSNTQTSSNTQSVLPTPSNTDTPLETDTRTASLTPNILPTTTSTPSNLPSYSSSPSVSPTTSETNTQSHTASYSSDPSNSLGSSPSRTALPSKSEIVSETQTSSYSPTLGSSPSATETNNPDFITIITTSEQSQEQRLSNIGSGAAIGVITTIIIIGAFYVFHKRNMKRTRAVSMRNIVYMRDSPEHMSHNPTFAADSSGVQDAVPVRMSSYRKNNLEVTRNKFEPVGINH
jgi:hypothetical protein